MPPNSLFALHHKFLTNGSPSFRANPARNNRPFNGRTAFIAPSSNIDEWFKYITTWVDLKALEITLVALHASQRCRNSYMLSSLR